MIGFFLLFNTVYYRVGMVDTARKADKVVGKVGMVVDKVVDMGNDCNFHCLRFDQIVSLLNHLTRLQKTVHLLARIDYHYYLRGDRHDDLLHDGLLHGDPRDDLRDKTYDPSFSTLSYEGTYIYP